MRSGRHFPGVVEVAPAEWIGAERAPVRMSASPAMAAMLSWLLCQWKVCVGSPTLSASTKQHRLGLITSLRGAALKRRNWSWRDRSADRRRWRGRRSDCSTLGARVIGAVRRQPLPDAPIHAISEELIIGAGDLHPLMVIDPTSYTIAVSQAKARALDLMSRQGSYWYAEVAAAEVDTLEVAAILAVEVSAALWGTSAEARLAAMRWPTALPAAGWTVELQRPGLRTNTVTTSAGWGHLMATMMTSTMAHAAWWILACARGLMHASNAGIKIGESLGAWVLKCARPGSSSVLAGYPSVIRRCSQAVEALNQVANIAGKSDFLPAALCCVASQT
jgi:hypothetical protein